MTVRGCGLGGAPSQKPSGLSRDRLIQLRFDLTDRASGDRRSRPPCGAGRQLIGRRIGDVRWRGLQCIESLLRYCAQPPLSWERLGRLSVQAVAFSMGQYYQLLDEPPRRLIDSIPVLRLLLHGNHVPSLFPERTHSASWIDARRSKTDLRGRWSMVEMQGILSEGNRCGPSRCDCELAWLSGASRPLPPVSDGSSTH